MKKQVVLIILLVLAVIAGGILIAHGLYSGVSEHKDNATTSTERNAPADQKSDIQTTVNESTDTDTSGRQTLRILIPKQKYQDVEKFVAKYNTENNTYIIDLVHTDTTEGIDPSEYDALIIPGGKHVYPLYYGAEVECNKHGFDKELDQFEFALVNMFVDARKPILGLCRGCQLVNVALGGTLKQDVGMGHYHDAARETDLAENFILRNTFGETVETLHYHHQAIDYLAPDLIVTMTDAEDDTIEGYIHRTLPIIAFQFHPDRMYVKDNPEIVETGRIFMDFFFDLCQYRKEL